MFWLKYVVGLSPKKERALADIYTLFISARAGGTGWGDGGGGGLHRDLRGCAPILGSGPFGHGPISRTTPSPPRQPLPPRPPVCAYKGSRVTFFKENAFMERDSRGIQKSTSELPTPRGTRVMAASSFTFQWKVHGRADQKLRFPAIFGTFPILMYF